MADCQVIRRLGGGRLTTLYGKASEHLALTVWVTAWHLRITHRWTTITQSQRSTSHPILSCRRWGGGLFIEVYKYIYRRHTWLVWIKKKKKSNFGDNSFDPTWIYLPCWILPIKHKLKLTPAPITFIIVTQQPRIPSLPLFFLSVFFSVFCCATQYLCGEEK